MNVAALTCVFLVVLRVLVERLDSVEELEQSA